MISMSGFGSGCIRNKNRCYRVECSSVNRKGLDITVILPRKFAALELKIREEVQKKISRGRLQITISDEITRQGKEHDSIIDIKKARFAFKELIKLQRSLQLQDNVSLATLLRVPGVLCDANTELTDLPTAWNSIRIALHQALDALLIMKKKEGKTLAADLKKRIHQLEQATKKISARIPLLLRHRHQQLQKRLLDYNVPIKMDDVNLLRELAFFAEKSNISEELTRLNSHVKQYQEALINSSTGARTLDYLAQEMFREFNTLSNKANDAEVSRWVVKSKSELDNIREQLANLE